MLGILGIFGDAGFLSRALAACGLPRLGSIYGLTGILIAHVFFNLPLVARLVIEALERTPAESWRLADALSMPRGAIFRFIEWPAVREALPPAASLVMLLCLTSFAIALTLGGGPAATTIEVALYQSLRFDLDLALAAKLAMIEFAIALMVLVAAGRATRPLVQGLRGAGTRNAGTRRATFADWLILAVGGLFVGAPVLSVAVDGLRSSGAFASPALWRAFLISLGLGISGALLAVALGFALSFAMARDNTRRQPLALIASVPLAVPAILVAAGWFILLLRYGDPARFAAPAVILLNGLLAVPYVVRALVPPIRAANAAHDRLSASLGIEGMDRWRLVDWPALKTPLALGLLLALLVSLGDLGIIALFGNDNLTTLPLLLYRQLGSYHGADAGLTALVLLALAIVLTWAAERLGRAR